MSRRGGEGWARRISRSSAVFGVGRESRGHMRWVQIAILSLVCSGVARADEVDPPSAAQGDGVLVSFPFNGCGYDLPPPRVVYAWDSRFQSGVTGEGEANTPALITPAFGWWKSRQGSSGALRRRLPIAGGDRALVQSAPGVEPGLRFDGAPLSVYLDGIPLLAPALVPVTRPSFSPAFPR